MDRDEIRAFVRFCDQASFKELVARQRKLCYELPFFTEVGIRRWLRWKLTVVESEIKFRLDQASRAGKPPR